MTTPPRTPIDRLTTALTERLHYENVGNDSTLVRTDDLDAVLAVVEAARALRERLTIDPGNVVSWAEWDTLGAALAAIEGAKP